jgi:hypothetical protein
MKITEFTKMVKHLMKLSSDINYYNIDDEMDNFEEWLYTEKQIELREDYEQHIDELIENETIRGDEHIYLTILESEKLLMILQDKLYIN